MPGPSGKDTGVTVHAQQHSGKGTWVKAQGLELRNMGIVAKALGQKHGGKVTGAKVHGQGHMCFHS